MQRIPSRRTVLAVWAHPDDEAYLAAGLLARTVAAGGRAVCWYATAGEAGTPDPEAWPPDRLARLRRSELRGALEVVGVGEHILAGFADGTCDEHDAAGVDAVRQAIESVRPDRIVTFGPDGITGHPDHRAVSRWTVEAWRTSSLGTDRVDLLFATMSHSFLARHRALHAELGLFDMAPGGRPVGCPDHLVDVSVVLDDDELDRKRRMLAAHGSQTEGLARAVGEEAYRTWWSVESFRRPTVADLAPARPAATELALAERG